MCNNQFTKFIFRFNICISFWWNDNYCVWSSVNNDKSISRCRWWPGADTSGSHFLRQSVKDFLRILMDRQCFTHNIGSLYGIWGFMSFNNVLSWGEKCRSLLVNIHQVGIHWKNCVYGPPTPTYLTACFLYQLWPTSMMLYDNAGP